MTINMGGNSTLHSTVSSDSVGAQGKFDLKSWQGLTELLKVGKNSLKPDAYAEFRNLVLQYAQHGGDIEYKKRIDDMVATFGRTPVVSAEATSLSHEKQQTSDAQPVQNSRRVAPRFDDISFMPKSLPSEEVEIVSEPIPTQTPAPIVEESTPIIPEPVPEPVSTIPVPPEPIVEPTPVVVTPPPAPEPPLEVSVQKETPVPVVPEPVPVEVPLVKEQKSEPVLEEEPLREARAPFMSLDQCKVRIAEIKRAVNAHFGNPVALMAVPNNLGKVYMTALLSALKAATPGAPTNVESAMIELERAYKALMEGDMLAPLAPEAAPVPEVTAIPTPESVPEIPKTIEPEPEQIPVLETPKVVEPDPIPTLEPEIIVSAPLPEVPVPPTPEPVATPTPKFDVAPILEPETIPVLETPLPPKPIPTPEPEIVIHEPELVPEAPLPPVPEPKPLPDAAPLSEKDVARMSILERIESEQGLPPLADPDNKEVSRAEVMHSAFEKTDHAISAVVSAVHKKLPPISGSIAELVEDEVSGYDTWQGAAVGPTSPAGSIEDSTNDFIHRENKHTKKGIVNAVHPDELQEQGIDAADIAVQQSELVSPQITTMLNKLLHEWSIFGGSGLFGIGPGGAEHPLYKQLAVLSMGEVVAGRWDGADPKVIKVIKQYVDAWRHEQGITYTLNETFEHYLRRVVQRIVKRQSI